MTSDSNNSKERAWPDTHRYRRSIRREFTLYVSIAVVLIMSITGYVITDQYVKTVSDSVVSGLLGQARSFANSAGKHMLLAEGPDQLMLNNLCRKLTVGSDDWYWAGVTTKDSLFCAHTNMQLVVTGQAVKTGTEKLDHTSARSGEAIWSQNDTMVVIVPILESGAHLGYLAAGASSGRIASARNRSIVTVASITAIMILLGLPLTTWIVQRRLRPITVMTQRLKDVSIDNLSFDLGIESRNELGYLAETLNVMGDRLHVAQKRLVEQERIERELEIAREIQAKLLPRECPVDYRFEVDAAYRSAMEVGGDYYDFLELDDNNLGLLVADVSGKSLPGMLVMLLTRDIVRATASNVHDPLTMLKEVNRQLKSEIKQGMFVTMFYGVLEKDSGLFRFASAGHNPLIVVRGANHRFESLTTKGYPLGLMPPAAFDQRLEPGQLSLNASDWIVQYSDGINEAHSLSNEMYGMERFMDAIRKNVDGSAGNMTDACMEDLQQFVGTAPQFDDITLVTMKWVGEASQNHSVKMNAEAYER